MAGLVYPFLALLRVPARRKAPRNARGEDTTRLGNLPVSKSSTPTPNLATRNATAGLGRQSVALLNHNAFASRLKTRLAATERDRAMPFQPKPNPPPAPLS